MLASALMTAARLRFVIVRAGRGGGGKKDLCSVVVEAIDRHQLVDLAGAVVILIVRSLRVCILSMQCN